MPCLAKHAQVPMKLQNQSTDLKPLAGEVITVINVEHATIHSDTCAHAQVRGTIARRELRCISWFWSLSILRGPPFVYQNDTVMSFVWTQNDLRQQLQWPCAMLFLDDHQVAHLGQETAP